MKADTIRLSPHLHTDARDHTLARLVLPRLE